MPLDPVVKRLAFPMHSACSLASGGSHLLLLALAAVMLLWHSNVTYAAVQLTDEGRQAVVGQISFLPETPADSGQADTSPQFLRAALSSSNWQPLSADDINFGYTETPIWYRFDLRNNGVADKRYLEISYPLLDHVSFYQIDDKGLVQRQVTGDRLPFKQRPRLHRSFVFPLTVPLGEQHQVFIRVQTSGAHQVPLTLWQPQAFYLHNQWDMALRGMLYGMLLVMAVFNLLLFLSMRERSFALFAMVQLLLLVCMSSLHGVALQYLFPSVPRLHELAILVGVPLAVVFFCLFCNDFLQLRERMPRAYLVVSGFAVVCALASLGGFLLPYALSTRISVSLVALTSIAILLIGVMRSFRGDRGGHLFVAAWCALLVGVVGHVLSLSGAFSSVVFSSYAMEIGAVMASLVFSFALGDRFHRERQARINEQQARIRAMHAREMAEAKIVENASHHYLTGLPNRAALEECLEQEIKVCTQQGEKLALVMLHLRGFDDINKTLGHENADQVLCQLAERLEAQVAELPGHCRIDAQGRIGNNGSACAHVEGITFACVFRTGRRDDMLNRMQILARGVQQPLAIKGMNLSVGVVCGCSMFPDDSQDSSTLLRHAFIAFDRAGHDVQGMAVFSEDSNLYNARRLGLLSDLQQAIDNDGLSLSLQPQIHAATGELFGFEALLRWQHPEHGFVPPDEFIPMAERGGFMQPLTYWVLERALSCVKRLEQNNQPLNVSVNISAVNLLDPQFVQQVDELLSRYALPPGRLVLEVTETAAMQDPEAALQKLRALSDAGVHLSIDDFGTGYSSLSYIRKLPVHEIKIDRSFVMEMDRNQDDATIVRATINMCHDLGYTVVAEGVETQHALDQLIQLGCDIAQGYFISRPLPEADVPNWVEDYLLGREDVSA
jgi:diguanylate cyclase (GGDEF)-like protein